MGPLMVDCLYGSENRNPRETWFRFSRSSRGTRSVFDPRHVNKRINYVFINKTLFQTIFFFRVSRPGALL